MRGEVMVGGIGWRWMVRNEKLGRAFGELYILLYKILVTGMRYLSRDVYEIPTTFFISYPLNPNRVVHFLG